MKLVDPAPPPRVNSRKRYICNVQELSGNCADAAQRGQTGQIRSGCSPDGTTSRITNIHAPAQPFIASKAHEFDPSTLETQLRHPNQTRRRAGWLCRSAGANSRLPQSLRANQGVDAGSFAHHKPPPASAQASRHGRPARSPARWRQAA